jgi:hypothetical protein
MSVELLGSGVELSPFSSIQSYAFASLPVSGAGTLAVVTDSNTATWGGTIAAGGTDVVLAFFNGSNWTVIGK